MNIKSARLTVEEKELVHVFIQYCFMQNEVSPQAKQVCAESLVLMLRPFMLDPIAREMFLAAFINASAQIPYIKIV